MTPTAAQPGARRHRVREVDFRRPSKFTREQVRRLEHAHDGFCQAAASRMSAELRSELQLAVLGSDQLPYGVVMSDEVSRQSFVSVLRIDQLGTELALVLDMPLAQCLVQRLLGGSGNAPGAGNAATLTAVEVAVARRAVTSLVESLSSAWLDLAQVSLSMAGTSTNPTSVQLVPSSEPTLLLNISAAIDGVASVVTLLMPHRSVEAIMHHFEQGAMYGPAPEDDARNRALMRSAVGQVDVELRAEAGAVRLPLEHVLALKPGDTVRLRRPVDTGVTLCVGDVAAYDATPGRNGNLRAVQVRAALGKGRGRAVQ
jgi:flagellar motor switch protein FliM